MTRIRERMAQTLIVAYASTGLATVANQLFFFLLLSYLPVDSVGLYSFALAIAMIYTYVADVGLGTFLVGELSTTHYRLRPVLEFIALMRAPAFGLAIVGLAGWTVIARPGGDEFQAVVLVGAMYLVQLIDVGIVPWFQARHRQNPANVVALIAPLGRLGAIGVPVVLGWGLSLGTVLVVSLVTQLVGTVCLLLTARVEEARTTETVAGQDANRGQLLRRFRERGPGLAVMYSINVLQNRLDWLLVSALISRVALANYSLANKIIESVTLLASVWARTSFPWLSHRDADQPHLSARLGLLRRLFVVSSGLVGVALFFWSSPLVSVLFGEKYAGADSAIALMTLATTVFMANQFFFYLVLVRRLETPYTYLILFATGLQVVVDVLLIPQLGITGAALGMVVLAVVVHIGQVMMLHRQGALPSAELVRLEVFLAGSIGAMGLSWLANLGPAAGTAVATAVVGFLGMFVVLGAEDRGHVVNWMTRVRPSSPTA